MGCLKLTYNQQGTPFKVVYRKTEPQQKGVQMWLSVDPVVKEYESPYLCFSGNPIWFSDPAGDNAVMPPDNYRIHENGNIEVERTDDLTNTYTYVKDDGSEVNLGKYNVSKSTRDEDFVMAEKGEGISFYNFTSSQRSYLQEDYFAAFLGATYSYFNKTGYKAKVNQFMGLDYNHSGKFVYNKPCLDIQYVELQGTSYWTNAYTTNGNVDNEKSWELAKSFLKYGFGEPDNWKGINYGLISLDKDGTSVFPENYAAMANHQHHFHVQGFFNNAIMRPVTLPTVTITARRAEEPMQRLPIRTGTSILY